MSDQPERTGPASLVANMQISVDQVAVRDLSKPGDMSHLADLVALDLGDEFARVAVLGTLEEITDILAKAMIGVAKVDGARQLIRKTCGSAQIQPADVDPNEIEVEMAGQAGRCPMSAPDAIVIEGATAQVDVPNELRGLLDRAADMGDILVIAARHFARLQIQIDDQVLTLAKANGESGDGKLLAQVQADLSDPVDATVSLVTGIIGFYGGADPDLGLSDQ